MSLFFFSSFYLFSLLRLFTALCLLCLPCPLYLNIVFFLFFLFFCSLCRFPLHSPPVFTGCPSNEQTKAPGGKEVACKRIRGVSCGCALSHASLVAHRDYQRTLGWLVVMRWFQGDLLNITDSLFTDSPWARPRADWLLEPIKVGHPSRSSCYSPVFKNDNPVVSLSPFFHIYLWRVGTITGQVSLFSLMSAHLSCDLFYDKGKNPEDVVRRYTEKIKVLPDEVRKGYTKMTHRATEGYFFCAHREGKRKCHKYTVMYSTVADEAFWLAIPGLYHLHGEAGHVIGIWRHPAAQRHQARAGGQTWQVRAHVPSAVPGGHVQQWQ